MWNDDNTTLPRDHQLGAGDIPWAIAPLDRLERRDPLAMTETELLAYCADLEDEIGWLRLMTHEALGHVAKLTDDLRRAARVVDALRRELRTLHQDVAA